MLFLTIGRLWTGNKEVLQVLTDHTYQGKTRMACVDLTWERKQAESLFWVCWCIRKTYQGWMQDARKHYKPEYCKQMFLSQDISFNMSISSSACFCFTKVLILFEVPFYFPFLIIFITLSWTLLIPSILNGHHLTHKESHK